MKKLLLLLLLVPTLTSAQLGVPQGGTGRSTFTVGDFIYVGNSSFPRLTGTTTPFFSDFTWGKATGTQATTTNLFSDKGRFTTICFTGDTCQTTWPISNTAWGAITGTLSSQTDLQSALDAKQGTLTFAYPLSNSANTVSLAFGTTTNNLWNGTNIWQNASSTIVGGLTIGGNATATNATTTVFFSGKGNFTTLCIALDCKGAWPTDNTASSTLLSDNNAFSGANSFSQTITGSVSGTAGSAATLTTPRNINNVSFNGSADITITAASSTLLANNNAFSGANSFAGLLSTASSTFQNFTALQSTSTNATTTNFYVSGLASTTALRANSATIGSLTVGSCTGCGGSSASSTLLTDNNSFTGANTFATLLLTSSSTLLNFTGLNSTTTNATSTSWFASKGVATSMYVNSGGLLVTGSSTLQNFTALQSTSTQATSTKMFSTLGNFNTLCIALDCKTAWPTGGGGTPNSKWATSTVSDITPNGGGGIIAASSTLTSLLVTSTTTIKGVFNETQATYKNDFYGLRTAVTADTNNWFDGLRADVGNGGCTYSTIASTTGRISLATGATKNAGCNLDMGDMFSFSASTSPVMETSVIFNSLTGFEAAIGFATNVLNTASLATTTAAVWFVFDPAVNANWLMVVRTASNAAATTTTAIPPVTGAKNKLRIEYTAGQVNAWINDALATSTLPTTIIPHNSLDVEFFIRATGAATRAMTIDYLKTWQTKP